MKHLIVICRVKGTRIEDIISALYEFPDIIWEPCFLASETEDFFSEGFYSFVMNPPAWVSGEFQSGCGIIVADTATIKHRPFYGALCVVGRRSTFWINPYSGTLYTAESKPLHSLREMDDGVFCEKVSRGECV